ncbi:MAG: hypothetical protein HY900_34280 [Deltaproteobacteria bacterium]|nr:hypothetical protein [Deltaproteobacteria bacterium]
MAGLVGYFGTNSARKTLNRGLRALRTGKTCAEQVLGEDRRGVIGVVARHRWEFDALWDEAEGLLVSIYGSPLISGSPWRKLEAREAAARYRAGGIRAILDADGFFTVSVLDARRQRAFVANDHCGSTPVFWAERCGAVAFAPEAKALFAMLGLAPRISEIGLVQLMNVGYVFGDNSMFEGVKRLEPAQVLEIDLECASVRTSRHWDLSFSPNPEFRNPTKAAAALFETVLRAQEAVPAIGARDVALALTGGFDSRVVLATRSKAEGSSYRSFSWGVDENGPLSDPAVGRQLAEACGVSHQFVGFEAASVPRLAPQWVRDSELLNANMGYFAAGREFLSGLPLPDLVLTGDHVIGLGAIPATRNEAIDSATGVPPCGIASHLEEVVARGMREEVRGRFVNEVQKAVERAPSDDPKALQDYLYYHIYAFGWLFSTGFYKEPAVSAFRPLMLRSIVDLVPQMPAYLRSDKIVLVNMLRRHLPEIARVHVASAFSLIDWGYEAVSEPGLREFLQRHTSEEALARTPLYRYCDLGAYRDARARFFAEPVTRVSRGPSLVRVGMDIRRWLARNRPLREISRALDRIAPKGVVGRPRRRSHADTFLLLSRVALVSLLQDAIDSKAFDVAAENQ